MLSRQVRFTLPSKTGCGNAHSECEMWTHVYTGSRGSAPRYGVPRGSVADGSRGNAPCEVQGAEVEPLAGVVHLTTFLSCINTWYGNCYRKMVDHLYKRNCSFAILYLSRPLNNNVFCVLWFGLGMWSKSDFLVLSHFWIRVISCYKGPITKFRKVI